MILLIGVFKLVKAIILLSAGVLGLLTVPEVLAERAHHAVTWLGFFPGHDEVLAVLVRFVSLSTTTVHKLGVVALLYGTVFAIEGVGLMSHKRWAEWMTVVVTSSFIPFEVYELASRFSPGKLVALVLNVVIVVYLVGRRVSAHPEPSEGLPPSTPHRDVVSP